jgi:C-terminal processing protease CtpA/Prc
MGKIILLMLALATHELHAQSPAQDIFSKRFTPEQLQQDFSLYRTALQKLHPALYRYTDRSAMDAIFDNTSQTLNQSMTYAEFYKLLAVANAQIRCQHTAVAPKAEDLQVIRNSAKMFPYEIMWDFDPVEAYAFSDLTNEGGIKPGTRIIAINGQSVQLMYDTLMKYLFTDGENLTSKQSRLVPFDFQHWYYFFIGRPDTFQMDFLVDGDTLQRRVAALTTEEYVKNAKKYILKQDPDIKRLTSHYIPKQKLKSSRLEFLNDSTSLLTLREYGSLEFIHSSFKKLKSRQTKHLIIDVRQNGGGWDDRGYVLFSYLIKQPSRYYDSIFTTITDIDFLLKQTDKDSAWLKESAYMWWKDGVPLSNSVSEGLSWIQPQKNRFEGKVYVLMDGKSMSTTAEFTAATQFNGLATFIGEESGGAYIGGNGADFATLILPNTQLSVNLPLAKYVMATSAEKFKGHGTMPDYYIRRTVKDWLALKDPQLQFALELISKQQKNKN